MCQIANSINSIIGSRIIGECLIAYFINSIIGSRIIGKCLIAMSKSNSYDQF